MKKNSSTVFNLLKIIVAFLLLYFLLRKIEWSDFFHSISNANLTYIVIAGLMYYLGVYVSVAKWRIILKEHKLSYSFKKLYNNYLIAGFFNNFLPTSIGGDTYRFYNLNSQTPNFKKHILSSILLERGFGFLMIFIVNFLLSIFYLTTITHNQTLLIFQIICWVAFFCLVLVMLFAKKYHVLFFDKLPQISITKKIKKLIITLINFQNKKAIFWSFFYSLLFALLIAIARILLFYAFNYNINFFYILYTSTLLQIFSLVPISLNSLGVTEGLGTYFYSLIGVPNEISLAIIVIGRISAIITSSLGGIVYVFRKK